MIATDQAHIGHRSSLVGLQQRIYRKARDARGPLEHIMPWLLEPVSLDAAWERVRSAAGAQTPGLDGVTRSDLEGRSGAWLDKLRHELADGRYRPQAPRYVDVPRDEHRPAGPTRRLGILALRDRVVHTAVRNLLEPIFDPMFHEHSFGFRCGRSVPGAIDAVCRAASRIGRSDAWAARLDVADCFETVDHGHLLSKLAARIGDTAFQELVRGMLEAAAAEPARRWFGRGRPRGLVQGSALSPLLCNLALNDLDHEFNATPSRLHGSATSPIVPGEVALFRYADDMLMLAIDRRSLRRAVRGLRSRLAQWGQKVSRRKLHVGPLCRGVEWLGVHIGPRQRIRGITGRLDFACTIPDARVRGMLERIDELTTPPSTRIDINAFDPARWIVSINTQLRQWAQAYRLAEDAPVIFALVDDHARRCTLRLLSRLTGRPARELRRSHRLRLPRGFHSWQISGVRLVQLAARAPVAAASLTRCPAWMRRRAPAGSPPAGPDSSG